MTTYSEADILTEGFKQRLRQLAELVGSVNSLAKSSGIAQSTIRKYFEKGEPPRSIIFRLAKAAGVRAEWLLTGDGPIQTGDKGNDADVVWIPERGSKIGEQMDGNTSPEHADGLVAFRRDWLRNTLRVDPAQLFLFRVEGDGMVPTLQPGNILLIDRADKTVRDGIFALDYKGVLQIKRLQISGRDTVEISSDNGSYNPQTTTTQAIGEVAEVIGRVVWADRKF